MTYYDVPVLPPHSLHDVNLNRIERYTSREKEEEAEEKMRRRRVHWY